MANLDADEVETEGDTFNTEMKFVSGGDVNVFTRTPANVTRDYFDGPPHLITGAKTTGTKKRKSGVDLNDPFNQTAKRARADADDTVKASPADKAPISAGFPVRRKQTRKFKGKNIEARPIPRTFEECDEADRMLVEWRDAKKEWGPIKAEWHRLTGESTATSTLPNRYTRLKTNFAVLKEEDSAILIQAKREIEDSFQAQKWSLVANVLLSKGGSDYTSCPIILQRQWKKLMLSGGAVVPPDIKDKDFDLSALGSDGDDDADEE